MRLEGGLKETWRENAYTSACGNLTRAPYTAPFRAPLTMASRSAYLGLRIISSIVFCSACNCDIATENTSVLELCCCSAFMMQSRICYISFIAYRV